MDKEKLKNIVTESLIIAKIKEEIFTIIKDFKSDSYINDNTIIDSINRTPISIFRSLSHVCSQNSVYRERIRSIVNEILKDID